MAPKKKVAITKAPARTRTLYFTAAWCPPCKAMHRLLAQHAEPLALVEVVEIDAQPELAREHGIRAVPTMIRLARACTSVRAPRALPCVPAYASTTAVIRPDGRQSVGGLSLRELRAFLTPSPVASAS